LEAEAAGVGLGVVGVRGRRAAPGDLGRGLLADEALDVEALAVEMAAGFLVAAFAGVVEVPLAFGVLAAGSGVSTVDCVVLAGARSSVGNGRACPPETVAAFVVSAGFKDAFS